MQATRSRSFWKQKLKLLLRQGDFEPALELIERSSETFSNNTFQFAIEIAFISQDLIAAKQYAAAEKYLRRCLGIREKISGETSSQVAQWQVANARSTPGESLLGQKNLDETEPLLLASYSQQVENEAEIPLPAKLNLYEAARRLKELYETLDKSDDAKKFETEMARWPSK